MYVYNCTSVSSYVFMGVNVLLYLCASCFMFGDFSCLHFFCQCQFVLSRLQGEIVFCWNESFVCWYPFIAD